MRGSSQLELAAYAMSTHSALDAPGPRRPSWASPVKAIKCFKSTDVPGTSIFFSSPGRVFPTRPGDGFKLAFLTSAFCSGDRADSMAFVCPIVHVSHWGSTSADWVDIALAPTTPHHEDNSPNYYTSDGDLRVVFCC